jgi:hypothetical protein
MNWDEIGTKLREPFPPNAIEWRLAQAGESSVGKPWAKVLAYLTNRAIMQRLDDTVGCGNWWNEYRPGPVGGVVCGISIFADNMAVTKWDGAENTDIESVKGGLSDAMKRAAVQWGIGRYLYGLDEGWADCSPQKQSGPEWHWQAAKQGKYASFYWRAPELPQWALPTDTKAKTRRSTPNLPEAGVVAPEPAVRGDNPFGIPPHAWLKLDAVQSADELLRVCGDFRDEARRDGWAEGANRFYADRKSFLDDLTREVMG